MWVSRKKFNGLEKKVADLEGQVQSQHTKHSFLVRLNVANCNSYDLIIENIQKMQIECRC